MGRKAQKNDSLPGSLDMLILRTLSRRDLHGYGIVQFIQQSSDNELLVEEGSLYPALQRLELNGWIEGVWGVTSNNRRARIYRITAAGRKQLAVETRKYAKLTLATRASARLVAVSNPERGSWRRSRASESEEACYGGLLSASCVRMCGLRVALGLDG